MRLTLKFYCGLNDLKFYVINFSFYNRKVVRKHASFACVVIICVIIVVDIIDIAAIEAQHVHIDHIFLIGEHVQYPVVGIGVAACVCGLIYFVRVHLRAIINLVVVIVRVLARHLHVVAV